MKATIGADNVLLPNRHQAIFWTNADLVLYVSLGTSNEFWNKTPQSSKQVWQYCLQNGRHFVWASIC